MKTDTSSDRYVPSLELVYVDKLGRKLPEPEVQFNMKTDWFRPKKVGDIMKENERNLIITRDHNLSYPELTLRVHVEGPPGDTRGFNEMFMRAGCEKASDIYHADLVVFAGGPDVNPEYYGEEAMSCVGVDHERDYSDIAVYCECLHHGIPMLGVCRGAQLLAVMYGGKLYQDVDNHSHAHQMWDKKGKELLESVSSCHHQAVIPCWGMDVIAEAYRCGNRWKNAHECVSGRKPSDVEAFFIRDTCSLGIQGHPEYKNYPHFTTWSLRLIDDYIVCNPDVEFDDQGYRRLKKEIRDEVEAFDQIRKPLNTTLSVVN